MLKTHAQELAAVIKQKESHHNPDMTLAVLSSGERTEWRVAVTGSSGLIDSLVAEHSSYASSRYERRRISASAMEFY